jgi:thiosulfate reductase cytochrome b subunit
MKQAGYDDLLYIILFHSFPTEAFIAAQDLTRFAAVSVIFLPLILVSGLFGMNVTVPGETPGVRPYQRIADPCIMCLCSRPSFACFF